MEEDRAETGAGRDGEGDVYEPTGEPDLTLAMRFATAVDVNEGGCDSSDDSSSSDVTRGGDGEVSVESARLPEEGEARAEAAARLAVARGDEMRAASMDGPLLLRCCCMGMGTVDGPAAGRDNAGSTALSL